jgi:hypothetical protein
MLGNREFLRIAHYLIPVDAIMTIDFDPPEKYRADVIIVTYEHTYRLDATWSRALREYIA